MIPVVGVVIGCKWVRLWVFPARDTSVSDSSIFIQFHAAPCTLEQQNSLPLAHRRRLEIETAIDSLDLTIDQGSAARGLSPAPRS